MSEEATTEAEAKTFDAKITELGDSIASLTLKEAVDLADYMKDAYGIEPAAGGAVMMAGAGGAAMKAAVLKSKPNSTSFSPLLVATRLPSSRPSVAQPVSVSRKPRNSSMALPSPSKRRSPRTKPTSSPKSSRKLAPRSRSSKTFPHSASNSNIGTAPTRVFDAGWFVFGHAFLVQLQAARSATKSWKSTAPSPLTSDGPPAPPKSPSSSNRSWKSTAPS